jgi:hypothetical protein
VSEQGPQRIKKTQKIKIKKNHIVTNSIVKTNLSNLPKLSHFREIGEKFRKFNRNPSAFQVDIIRASGYS